jgi:pimeloyl-ACP methyl ester carboxylesterase
MSLMSVLGASQATAQSGLQWGPCPAGSALPGLECTTVQVPVDYREPQGRQLDVAVSRLPSKDPSQRRGVLVTNPGGPGAGGLVYPGLLAGDLSPQPLPRSIQAQYDVIGFDPRGGARRPSLHRPMSTTPFPAACVSSVATRSGRVRSATTSGPSRSTGSSTR